MVVGGQRYATAALPPGNRPGIHWQKAGWAPGLFWTGTENLPPRPAKFDPRIVQPVQSVCTASANPTDP